MHILISIISLWVGSLFAPAGATDPPLTEPEVRAILRLIEPLPDSESTADRYNPRDMVAAVNALHAVGKDQALRVLRHSPGRSRIVVMRFLFQPPEGQAHPVIHYVSRMGAMAPEYPAFPAVVFEGIPLYIAAPTPGTGNAGSAYKYLDWYREHGTPRADALRPIDDPLIAWERWIASDLRAGIANGGERDVKKADDLVRSQLLRMIDTIHPREFDKDTLRREDIALLWERVVATLQGTETRWDEERSMYVRAEDGTFIEPREEPVYRGVSWTLPVEGRAAHLRVQRISEHHVLVYANQVCRSAPPVPDMTVRVFDGHKPERELTVLTLEGSFTNGTQGSVAEVEVQMGTAIRASLIVEGKPVAASPALDPDEQDADEG